MMLQGVSPKNSTENRKEFLEDIVINYFSPHLALSSSPQDILHRELLFVLERIDETKKMHGGFRAQLKVSRVETVNELLRLYPHLRSYQDRYWHERNSLNGRIIEIESAIRREEMAEWEKLSQLRGRLLYLLNQLISIEDFV